MVITWPQVFKKQSVKLYTFKVLLLCLLLSSCSSVTNRWVLNSDCDQLPKQGEWQYRVKLVNKATNSTERLLVVNQWSSMGLSSVAVSPLGVKIFSAEVKGGKPVMDVNPLYRKIDFSVLLQGLLVNDIVFANSALIDSMPFGLCSNSDELWVQKNNTDIVVVYSGETYITFLAANIGSQVNKMILHSKNSKTDYAVNVQLLP